MWLCPRPFVSFLKIGDVLKMGWFLAKALGIPEDGIEAARLYTLDAIPIGLGSRRVKSNTCSGHNVLPRLTIIVCARELCLSLHDMR